uniref:Putative secreted protein n=1 Tax=Amblyomma tuberculatum TaxID=48802 RepID=A0A6M2E203_9ACAR
MKARPLSLSLVCVRVCATCFLLFFHSHIWDFVPPSFLCLDGYLFVAHPFLFVDLAECVHECLAGQLQALDAQHVVLELFLQLGRRRLLPGEVVQVDFENFILCLVSPPKVLQYSFF